MVRVGSDNCPKVPRETRAGTGTQGILALARHHGVSPPRVTQVLSRLSTSPPANPWAWHSFLILVVFQNAIVPPIQSPTAITLAIASSSV